MKSYLKNILANQHEKRMLEHMSNETEDPSPFINIIMAGAVVPGKNHLNETLTEHLSQRIEHLHQRQIELKDIYLLAPWRTIRDHKERQRNIAKLALLESRLSESKLADSLRSMPEITILPVNPEPSAGTPGNNGDAVIIDLQDYGSQQRLDHDTAAKDMLAVVQDS